MNKITYSTKEQAERMGKIEAEKLTKRGYATTFVRAEQVVIKGALHLDGVPSEQQYVATNDIRWTAILS
jgi:hypothetical protein